MIIREYVTATMLVAEEVLAQGTSAMDAVRTGLIREVVREGDKSAWRIRPESVAVYADGVFPRTMQRRFSAVWSPAGARLVGGEYDGDVVQVRRSDLDGLPVALLTLTYRAAPGFSSGYSLPSVMANPSYTRVGTDPIEDVWVYEVIR